MGQRIRILDQFTVNKIAAGEVVENPASVIKELIENSIDAASHSITVEIQNGGISYLRVTDDGIGISSQDIPLAFKRHATSKIKDEKDLQNINSLGFRGEALASIASVSHIEMITKNREDEIGTSIKVEGGNIVSKKPIGCPNGTTVIIRNLFYNTPARLKYLKSTAHETRQITDIINKMILSRPDITFKYINNGKTVLISPGDGNLLNAIVTVYGKDIANDLIYVDYASKLFSMKGYIGKPGISKPSRRFQSIFINGRFIKNDPINDAILNAYKTMVMVNKFPFAVLYIYIPPENLDVNVHPTKMEVRFDKQNIITQMISVQIRKTLLSEQNRLNKQIPMKSKPAEHLQSKNINKHLQSININLDKLYSTNNFSNKTYNKFGFNCIKYKKDEDNIKVAEQNIQITNYKIIGQIFDTYIILEQEDDIYLIDQHAAHERLLFEKYLHMYEKENVNRQMLGVPIVQQLSAEYMQVYRDNIYLLKRLGFDVQEFGNNTISIREIPVFINADKVKDLLLDILDILLNDKLINPDQIIENKIITKACKTAVKANDKLDRLEIMKLLDNIRSSKIPPTCPHGRPIFIKIRKYDLEKKFKRIQ